MLEWWEVLLISVASSVSVGLVGLASAYFAHRWTRGVDIEKEEREARRDQRRDAMAPIVQFLETAGRAHAARVVKASLQKAYDDNVADMQTKLGSYEQVKAVLLRDVEDPPSNYALTRELYHAHSAAPSKKWNLSLAIVWGWVLEDDDEGSVENLRNAIQEVRALVEDYIASGEVGGEKAGP